MGAAAVIGGYAGWQVAPTVTDSAPSPAPATSAAAPTPHEPALDDPDDRAADQVFGPVQRALTVAERRSAREGETTARYETGFPDGRAAAARRATSSTGEQAVTDDRDTVPVADQPASITLPSIDVTAPLAPLGLDAEGRLEAPSDFDSAGWWHGGPAPGERGPAVIAGHVDSHTGPAVFSALHRLAPGDPVEVRDEDGTTVRFEVGRVEQHAKDAFPTGDVYDDTPQPTLRLITCAGPFDAAGGRYEDNLIVYARHAAP